MRRISLTTTLCTVLISSVLAVPSAGATSIEPCRIKGLTNDVLSLGFPVSAERLVNIAHPKVLVIPVRLSDEPNYSFVQSYKDDYKVAAENISALSNGKSKIEFVFNNPIDMNFSTNDMIQLKRDQKTSFQNDLSKSTWGFVRRVIAEQDSKIDFTGIDAVVIEGSSNKGSDYIGEAMMFSKNTSNTWRESIKTAEGTISNTVLLDRHSQVSVVTHELLHLYGLTDLYGGDAGPGQLSLMDSQNIKLLAYEKWVLGWLPDTAVTCVLPSSENSTTKVTLDYKKGDQLAVIQPTQGLPYIAETSSLDGQNYFAFYSLDLTAHPPITLYQERIAGHHDGIKLSDFSVIGAKTSGPDYSTVISNWSTTSLTINIYKSSFENSTTVKQLFTAAAQAKAAAVLAAQKKVTITCVRGKLVKKVTAVKPVCPAGYTKK